MITTTNESGGNLPPFYHDRFRDHVLFTFQWRISLGLFDAIAGLQKMAEDPELGNAALSIGKAAQSLPVIIMEIRDLLHAQISIMQDAQVERAKWGAMFSNQLDIANNRLVEISLGFDNLGDPVKRPPFHASDVEAAMRGSWPEQSKPVDLEGLNPHYGKPMDGE